MRLRIVFLISCLWALGLWSADTPQPEDFAFWIEQIPNSTSVLVNASWAIDRVQGFAFAVCHDSAETTLGAEVLNIDVCRDDSVLDYPAVECTFDLAHSPCSGGPPGFVAVSIYDGGVTLGVVLMCMAAVTYPATDRIELLKVTYTPLGPHATLDFCDDYLGRPTVNNVVAHDGLLYYPARQDGIVVDFGPAFIRGDANADGAINIADPIFIYQYLFRGGRSPTCRRACDANADGLLNVADVVKVLGHLFSGYGPLPEPRECGRAAVHAPGLGCEAFEPCRSE